MCLRRTPFLSAIAGLLSIAAIEAADDTPALFHRAEELAAEARYTEAEPLYQEVLTLQERNFGRSRPETIRVLNALANLYHAQERDREAESLCRRALAVGESTLDPLDDRIATSLNCLADIYRSTHRYVGAEPLYRRALAILEARLGADHPWVGTIVNNLASLRAATQHYEEAGALFERALEIADKNGGESSQIAGILGNLAVCAMDRGKYRAAEPYLLRAIQLERKAHGAEAPSMVPVLENYATVLRKTRRAGEAKQLDVRIAFLRQGRPSL